MNSAKLQKAKINIQPSVVFLYMNNYLKKMQKTTPFTISSSRIKYLGVNTTKESKDLLTGNYKTSLKESKEARNKWEDVPCS